MVTGGSRGLGLAMTRLLAASGYRVIAVARKTSEELEAAAGAARDARQGAIEFRACDLSDVAQIKPLVRSVRADFGPIYGLINNAGLGTSGLLSTMRDTDIDRLIRLNTISPIVLTKYVARMMMSERSGRIVNIVSIGAARSSAWRMPRTWPIASNICWVRAAAISPGSCSRWTRATRPERIPRPH